VARTENRTEETEKPSWKNTRTGTIAGTKSPSELIPAVYDVREIFNERGRAIFAHCASAPGHRHTQDHAAQVKALKAAGCKKIHSEKASGKSTSLSPHRSSCNQDGTAGGR
jgi:hypothetical protein